MKRTDYPYWAYPTFREFQKKKRKDMDALLEAVQNARLGCAYFPDGMYKQFKIAVDLLHGVRKSLRTREWK